MRFGLFQEALVGRLERGVVRRHYFDLDRLTKAVLDHGHAAEDLSVRHREFWHGFNRRPESMRVRLLCADLFAQAHGHHLQQT